MDGHICSPRICGGSGPSIKPESWVPIPEMGTEQPHFGQSGVVFLDFYMFN